MDWSKNFGRKGVGQKLGALGYNHPNGNYGAILFVKSVVGDVDHLVDGRIVHGVPHHAVALHVQPCAHAEVVRQAEGGELGPVGRKKNSIRRAVKL